ncbi:MAG: class I SAM-dependent methyltransferase [archaeon]|nr:class I SAM-dependent methyltransferase [archaeon]
MGFKQKMVTNCRKPQGKFGKLIALMMNIGHAKMTDWAMQYFNIEPDYKILDIGCGGGGNIKKFAKIAHNGKVFGIDYSEISVETSKKVNKKNIKSGSVEIFSGSVSSLPFEDNMFDLVTGFECYYFWPEFQEDLKEVKRVLKPQGNLVIVADGYKAKDKKNSIVAETWAELGDFPLYTTEEFIQFFKNAGFNEIEIITDEANVLVKGKKG